MSTPEIIVHIVDDEEAVRNSLAFLLTTAGFAVRVHQSAADFLAVAPGATNACLITDLRMPEIDGVELLRRLNAADAMLPAIVVTGHGDVQMAVQAMKNGAIDFIEKPFSDDVLIESINRAAARATERSQSAAREEQVRSRIETLSDRERQVMRGVVEGQQNKTIASELGISPRTVEVYRASLMGKMQAKSLPDLIRMVVNIDLASLAEEAQDRHRDGTA